MHGIAEIKDWSTIIAGVNRYVDTTATGANTGLSKTDAWTSIESAITDTTNGRVVAVRRGQTHTATGQKTIGGVGTIAAPIMFLGDCDALDIWSEDSGDTRTIYDLGANEYYVGTGTSNGRVVLFANLECQGTDDEEAFRNVYALARFENCVFDMARIYNAGGAGTTLLNDCDLDIANASAQGNVYLLYGSVVARGSSFDGGAIGIRMGDSCQGAFAEDSTFGTSVSHSTADITMGRASTILPMRNCVFGSTTEVAITGGSHGAGFFGQGVWAEDYDGTKGAWRAFNSGGWLTAISPLYSVAAASTAAGQRSGGAATVLCSELAATRADGFARLIGEWEPSVAIGSYTVDVYLQPDVTGGAVPDTAGDDADLWVTVDAWDVATGTYVQYDSRDEGSQSALVDDAWRAVRVSGVEADVAGTLIVRAYQRNALAGANKLYVDRKLGIP